MRVLAACVVALMFVLAGPVRAQEVGPTGKKVPASKKKRVKYERKVVQWDGTEISYFEMGDSKNSPATLIFIHGWGDSMETWLDVMAPLSEDFHVLAYDTVGFGGSGNPRLLKPDWELEKNFTMDVYLEQLQALRDAKMISTPVLIGNSMGAQIAMACAAKDPLSILGLVLIDMSGGSVMSEQYKQTTGMIYQVVSVLPDKPYDDAAARKVVDRTLKDILHNDALLTPRLTRKYLSQFQSEKGRRTLLHTMTDFRYQVEKPLVAFMAKWLEFKADKEAKAPKNAIVLPFVTAIWGKNDVWFPPTQLDKLKESAAKVKYPKFEGVVLDDCGHLPQLEKPAEVVETIRKAMTAMMKEL